MGTNISGASGPLPLNEPGNYGRNAAIQTQKLAESDPVAAQTASIQYTPGEHPNYAEDATGYAEKDVCTFSKDQKDVMTHADVSKTLGGDAIADQYIKALDTNNDGKIDVPEMAAYVLLQDDSSRMIDKTVEAFGDGNILKSDQLKPIVEAAKSIRMEVQGLFGKANSIADGRIDPHERAFAEFSVMTLPTVTRETLQGISTAFNLREKYEQMKAPK